MPIAEDIGQCKALKFHLQHLTHGATRNLGSLLLHPDVHHDCLAIQQAPRQSGGQVPEFN